MAYETTNPYSGKTLEKFDEHSDKALDAVIGVASARYETWRAASRADRSSVAMKAAVIMRSRADELARLATLEMGKRIEEAQGEVMLSADIVEYYARNAERFLAPVTLDVEGGEASIHSESIGVIFGIQPWNFPYYQLARFAAPNVVAGNVVMVKHASNVPQCAAAFESVWREAGAPPGTYTNLRISHGQTNEVIDDARVRGVALTGGAEAGRPVAARAGKNLKKSTMELGGNDAFIVLDDADLAAAVRWAVWAKMNYNGQCCVAAKRIIAVESIADAFLQEFTSALSALRPGDPMERRTTLAPMSSESALKALQGQVKKAVSEGAEVVLGGQRIDRNGAFMEPTVLTGIEPGNPAYRDELFGPVALFFRVDSEDAAIALANDSDYGLGCSVFTKDVKRGKRVADHIETGMVFINHPVWTAADLPFGGVKGSGYGRELGSLGAQEFVNKKLVRVLSINAPA